MGLKFEKLEPVEFGDEISETPVVPQGLYFRLSECKFDSEINCESSAEILAEAFPKNREKVKGYLSTMTPLNLQRLVAYLMGGEEMLESVNAVIKNAGSKTGEE